MSKYKIRYLPLFVEDLEQVIVYIRDELSNPEAAKKFLSKVEKAILKRSYNPTSFEVYLGNSTRKNPYYKIYVNNYIIFYVVIDNVMEVRRIIHNKRNYMF